MTAPGQRSAAATEPPSGLAERFALALARLLPERGAIGLAVSGGPDSLAMLLLAAEAIPGMFEVATVDHGLRPESAGECALVARLCAARGIPCAVLSTHVAGGNVQAQARMARYAALAEWAEGRGLAAVATAHQADDQAETVLMRLNRGSGVSGLAGVRERGLVPGSDMPLIRPLLGFRRAELEGIVQRAGIVPVTDPSNADDRFDRVRVRRALAGAAWIDPLAVAMSAANLAQADAALEWAAQSEWQDRVRVGEGEIAYRPHAPRAIGLRIVERAISRLGGSPRGGEVARLLDKLAAGESANVAGVLASVTGEEWVFRAEPPRRSG